MNSNNVYSMSFGKVIVYFFKRVLLLAAKLAGLKGFCLCIALGLFLSGKISGTMLVSVMGLVLCNAGGQHIAESLNSRKENKQEEEEHEQNTDGTCYNNDIRTDMHDTVRAANRHTIERGMQRIHGLLSAPSGKPDGNSDTADTGGDSKRGS